MRRRRRTESPPTRNPLEIRQRRRDGDALQISAVTDPGGTMRINTTGFDAYTPPLNFLGNVTFTYGDRRPWRHGRPRST